MTSKKDEYVEWNDDHEDDLPDEPKTPHEEVMFVVESTNEIVSKIWENVDPHRKLHTCPKCKFSWYTE